MIGILVGLVLIVNVHAQQCSNEGTGPCLNNLCPDATKPCLTAPSGTVVCCAAPVITTAATTAKPCVDKLNPNTGVSDCPRLASYCNNSVYYTLMTDQCPKTCSRCSATSATTITATSTCVDKVNPATGVSDCPQRLAYCNNSAYRTLMVQQCPRSCGFCSG